MNRKTLIQWAAALITLAVGLANGDANAGIFRSYISVAGNDANPCTLPAPCRLLPAALAAVNDGGEIWMLDSANFNTATVAVTKSVTILAVPGALGSVVANGGDAMSINAAGAKVTLRNLVILNLSGTTNTGIAFAQGVALTVEGCELYGLNNGISASAAGSTLTIKDTTIRDNLSTGVSLSGTVEAALRNVSVLNNNAAGISASNGAAVSISLSSVVGSNTGIAATAAGSTVTQVAITNTTMSGNTIGVQSTASSGTATAQVLLSGVTLTRNGTGASISGATASIFTRQNNTFKFNGFDVGAGTLSPLAAQ